MAVTPEMGTHLAAVSWSDDGGFVTGRYSRTHELRFDGGAVVRGSSSPAVVPLPLSDPAGVDPEEALVAAVSACHMLWFLDLAGKAGLHVLSYRDRAEGSMGRIGPGKYAITRIELAPDIVFAGQAPDPAMLDELHARAHDHCFIANSLKAEIVVRPPGGNAAPFAAVSAGEETRMTQKQATGGETAGDQGNLGGTKAVRGATVAGASQPSAGGLDEEQVGLPDATGGLATQAATLGNADGALADAAGAASGAALGVSGDDALGS